MTARELIRRALMLLGVLAAGESLPANDAADALSTLNDMLDAWRAERLTLHAQARTSAALVGGDASYTIGPAANIAVNRPIWIDGINILIGSEEYQLRQYLRNEWREIADKTRQGQPEGFFYNPTAPLGTVDFYPTPDATYTVIVYGPDEALPFVQSLDTVISMPPGWAKALRYNLALELAPEYGKAATEAIIVPAVDAKSWIKRATQALETMSVDSALQSRRYTFDINIGDFR
jgi:hypothetical protein